MIFSIIEWNIFRFGQNNDDQKIMILKFIKHDHGIKIGMNFLFFEESLYLLCSWTDPCS